MDDKITIIEGPPPVFENVNDGWALGLNESPDLYDMVLTKLRTFNGPALVERCHRTWKDRSTMFLHFRNDIGLEQQAPILAARFVDSEDGHVLVLWIRRQHTISEQETGSSPDDQEEG